MQETKEQQGLHRLLQVCVYFSLLLEVLVFVFPGSEHHELSGFVERLLEGVGRLIIYQHILYSKFFTLLLILLASIGTLSKKKRKLNPLTHIVLPLGVGLLLFFGSALLVEWKNIAGNRMYLLLYAITSFSGTLLIHLALDNISKIISSKLGQDLWNIEGESFQQTELLRRSDYSVNIPMLFYYQGRVRKGWINVESPFRGTLLIGTPGSGKSFGVVGPFIRQLINKDFTMCLYDFKFPDLAQIAWYQFNRAKAKGKCRNYNFHVLNLSEVERSRRINPWRKEYITSLADASETAEALVEALKKGDRSGGSDQFFTQSAVNFLACCIYLFSRAEGGRYSSLPHVLAFLNMSYEEVFDSLFSEQELHSLLSPFLSAYKAKAFDQLEGQVGTLKVFISRMATKESFWVFSGDDFDLKISCMEEPSVLVLANDPATQNINSASYSIVLNRLTRLINTKGNKPCALIIDEVPTLFLHKVENLIATARSNKVAVLLGLQELPQFMQQYGKETSSTITAVIGNVLSGSVRNKETLDWLERLFGKVKQGSESLSIDRNRTSISLSEKLEPLIPAGKIASLRSGELVGLLAGEHSDDFTGQYESAAVHCKVNLNIKEIEDEQLRRHEMPLFYDFKGKKDEILKSNFLRIHREVRELVGRIRSPSS
ncbi:type IV secretory system conjugative DNA transfer family protein [Pedobacter sp. SYSU D00535]|uniref:type IV secretory system conjugative DNA transfer family protein n=1 Tax=Pedobacter sp. SYSU D00535 TaxID=2810308 RepID=UPI001A97A0EA|nr:type IV secretory system conjugative DNA transfer family protein [Pedobacter sp. SYSU D00535]